MKPQPDRIEQLARALYYDNLRWLDESGLDPDTQYAPKWEELATADATNRDYWLRVAGGALTWVDEHPRQ